MQRKRFLTIAAALVGVAAFAFMAHSLFGPKHLRIAVGPVGGGDLRVVVSFLQALQRERANIRLKLVLTDGPAASAEQFALKKADLAVVRTDIAVPPEAATVAIMRRDSVFFVTRPGSKIEKIGDLRGKTIGYLAGRASNERILSQILAHYEVPETEMVMQSGTVAELTASAQENRIDAMFVVGPISDRLTRLALQSFPDKDGERAGLLAITEADALAAINPALDTVEISRGAFGGEPPRPDENTTTLAATHRLVARRSIDETTVSELTRLLFALRLTVAADAPLANQIELPSSDDRGAKYPVHAGTTAYSEGETKTFFERYGDWIYLFIMGFSLVGSVIAAFSSRFFGNGQPKKVHRPIHEFLELTLAARSAPDLETLNTLDQQADTLFLEVLAGLDEDENPSRIVALSMLIQELRHALHVRRLALQTETSRALPLIPA